MEARLEQVESGLVPVSPGWFVLNLADAAWVENELAGGITILESDEFFLQGRPELTAYEKQLAGFNVRVIQPGQIGLYHYETHQQEDFLVVQGECLLLVEEQQRRLRAWDYVHCPPGTAHGFVGAGDGPCVIVGAGNRTNEGEIVRPRSELALSHGAGVEEETTRFPHERFGPWPLQRPARWGELPWAT
ncbi:MAG: cupin domain-containing protein [Gaiellaceae bacterium]